MKDKVMSDCKRCYTIESAVLQSGGSSPMSRFVLSGIMLGISFCTTALCAEERHQDYVFISDDAYSKLQCSVLSAHARYGLQEQRLFTRGLEQARLFIEAARAGRVSQDDFARANVVWPLALRAWNFQRQDTSTEFVTGQVYEMIWTETTSRLGDRSRDKSTYQEPARAEFSTKNCALLAR